MTTIHFPSMSFATIQDAVNAAVAGDVVVVAPGVYTGQISITKILTLRGAQYLTPAPGRQNPLLESVLQFAPAVAGAAVVEIASPLVSVEGFTIQCVAGAHLQSAAVSTNTSYPPMATDNYNGLRLSNNIIQNSANGMLIGTSDVAVGGTPRYLFEGNWFRNDAWSAPFGPPLHSLYFQGTGPSFSETSGVVIRNNALDGLTLGATVVIRVASQCLVANNTLTGTGALSLAGTREVVIDGNNFVECAESAAMLLDGTDVTTVTNNCFVRSAVAAIELLPESSFGTNSTVRVNRNNFITTADLGPSIWINGSTALQATENFFDPAPVVVVSPAPGGGNSIVVAVSEDSVVYLPTLTVATRNCAAVPPAECAASLEMATVEIVTLTTENTGLADANAALTTENTALAAENTALADANAALRAQLIACQQRRPVVSGRRRGWCPVEHAGVKVAYTVSRPCRA